MVVDITHENSTVDGYEWNAERFAGLGFASTDLASDDSYPQGCLKYLPCLFDSDPTCGHRVRSIFKKARPVNIGTREFPKWKWDVEDLISGTELSRERKSRRVS